MSDWQRFQLTNPESQYSQKYEDPTNNKTPVVRRFYYSELTLDSTQNTDTTTFQISRRARTMGITFCGDVDRFLLEIQDVSGEQYTVGPTHVPLLCNGYCMDPRSEVAPSPNLTGLVRFLPNPSMGPYVIEPNIVTRSNQTLQFIATRADTTSTFTALLGMVLHVVEFPGMPGSPL